MTFAKQTFIDADIESIDPANFDLVQPKYDGHWCRLEFDEEGNGIGYTTSDRAETELRCPVLSNSILICEHLFGTNWSMKPERQGKIIAFDLVRWNGEDLSRQPYRSRLFRLAEAVSNAKHPRLFATQSWPIDRLDGVWKSWVLGRGFEGVVLRRWNQVYSDRLHRCKRDFEATYVCVGFEEGQGKHAGRLGALVIQLPSGKLGTVGGGFSDLDREYIWNNQHEFINRQFDAVGKQLFDSGALRHPNFVRWK